MLTADNAQDALQILGSERVDLLLCDVIMPGMDGYQLSEEVNKRFPEVKIQLVSGYSDEPTDDAFRLQLYNSILYKPYTRESLVRQVRNLLDEDS